MTGIEREYTCGSVTTFRALFPRFCLEIGVPRFPMKGWPPQWLESAQTQVACDNTNHIQRKLQFTVEMLAEWASV